jgi:tRNA-dihydrouridine synthase A
MTTTASEATATGQAVAVATSAPGYAGRSVAWPLSVAPMMDRTDRHFRALLRRITRRSLLYTEMITTGAVLHGDRDRLLGFDPDQRPLVLQLGGDDPAALAECARVGWQRGYDEINLNVGCPSDRVQAGSFGVCLMARPQAVAEAVAAMRSAVPLPVSVKHRIGFDHLDGYEDLLGFVVAVAEAGCDRFTVHARKAWLAGLSPKENREVPPLRYDDVHRLKAELAHLRIEINGGFRTLEAVAAELTPAAAGGGGMDGVMIGRLAYEDPWALAAADRLLFGDPAPPPTRRRVVEAMLGYVEEQRRLDVPLARISRHLLELFAGRPGARAWRRALSEGSHRPGAGPELIAAALARLPVEVLDEPAEQAESTGSAARFEPSGAGVSTDRRLAATPR